MIGGTTHSVTPALVAGIHAPSSGSSKSWTPGTSPGVTGLRREH
jgi:hypothetical protein